MKLLILLLSVCSCLEVGIINKTLETITIHPNIITNTTPKKIELTIKQKCLQKLNISYDDVEDHDHSMLSNYSNKIYNNYFSCYWKYKNLQNENGEVNYEALTKVINEAVKVAMDATDVPLLNTLLIATEIMEDCKGINGKTHGEKASRMRNCMFGKLVSQRNGHVEWEDIEDIAYLDLQEEECVNELNLNAIGVENINRHYEVPENHTRFGDFLACYWKKADMMDQSGNFNVTTLITKLDEIVKYELLSRSRAVYLSDVLTKSIIKGCKEIRETNKRLLVAKMQHYILQRLPYFKVILY